jgi:general secretion pathway protein G
MFRRHALGLLLVAATLGGWSCAAPGDSHDISLLRAREQVLRDNLYRLRKSIDLYAADHNALPQSLDDLMKAGYLREVPADPMTGKNDWGINLGDDPNARGRRGIADVHSASGAKSSDGSLYRDW